MTMTPGARLTQLRHQAGLSQEELAGRLGTSRAYVGRIEKDTAALTNAETIRRYAEAVGVPADEVFSIVGRIPEDIEEALRQGSPAMFARIRSIIQDHHPE